MLIKTGIGLFLALFIFLAIPSKAEAPTNNFQQARSWLEAPRTPEFATEMPLTAIFSPEGYIIPLSNPLSPAEIQKSEREKILELINELWGNQSKTALRIFWCESKLDPLIISKTGDVGITQINLSAHWEKIPGETKSEKIVWLQNRENNLSFAYQLYVQENWIPWVCY